MHTHIHTHFKNGKEKKLGKFFKTFLKKKKQKCLKKYKRKEKLLESKGNKLLSREKIFPLSK